MELTEGKKIATFDWIDENVYLGDVEGATSLDLLKEHDIQIIINISNSRYGEYGDITYLHIDIDDKTDVDISIYFDSINDLIKINKDKKILIHCMNGVSRSVTIVLQYLMQKMNLKESYNYLKSKRSQYTRPNRGFIKQLLEKEEYLYRMNSMKMKDFFH